MRHMNGVQIGRLAVWHRTTHAALLREVDNETLVASRGHHRVAAQRGMFDSRKCELSFGEKLFDSSMEDSPALPVFTPMNF